MPVCWLHMTTDRRKHWWQPGFELAFFTVGLPYWLIPYAMTLVSLLQFIAAKVVDGVAKKRSPPDEPEA